MSRAWIGLAIAVLVTGCSSRKSSLLLERLARGPLDEAQSVAQRMEWRLEPLVQTQTKKGIEVTVHHASRQYLDTLFKNQELFGAYAGRNPYYLENLVFYVKIVNRSDEKVLVQPGTFTVVDDRGDQYGTIGVDYVTALGESRQPLMTTTRGIIEDARPGYFGVSLPVGKIVSAKPQGQFALIKQSSLQQGYYYPGVSHDGLLAFWNPSVHATKLRLWIANLKTDFDANDLPGSSLDFVFEFDATKP